MPSTSVNLKRLKRGKGYVYQIDYRVNGKRIREVVGTDKRTAELKRATIQQDLNPGETEPSRSCPQDSIPQITHRIIPSIEKGRSQGCFSATLLKLFVAARRFLRELSPHAGGRRKSD